LGSALQRSSQIDHEAPTQYQDFKVIVTSSGDEQAGGSEEGWIDADG
jgi:hypothetical protein